MCDDDDFHFEFDDQDCIDDPLFIFEEDDRSFVGHVIADAQGVSWMIRPYEIFEAETPYAKPLLVGVPPFKLDPLSEVIIVTNSDEIRSLHNTSELTLGHINNIPFLCGSTRH